MTLTSFNSIPVQLPATEGNDNVVDMLATRQLQSGWTMAPHVALPVARMAFPAGTVTRNVDSIEARNHANG